MFSTKSSKVVYKNKWLELYEDVVNYKGKSEIFNKIKTRDVAVVLPIFSDGSLLMIENYRYPIRKKLLEIPGGFIEKNEKPPLAAKRELIEETGYSCKNLKNKGWFYCWPARSTQKIHVFVAKDLILTTKQALEDFEYSKIRKLSKKQVTKELSRSIQSGITLSALLLGYY